MRNHLFTLLCVLMSLNYILSANVIECTDSIQHKIKQLDTIKDVEELLNARFDIINYIENSDYALYLELANKNLELAKKENLNWAQIDIYMELGESFIKKGNFSVALNNLNTALQLAQNDDYKPYAGWVILEIGNAYEGMENYSRAIEFYLRSLNVFVETNNAEGIAMVSTNIGNCYLYTGDFPNAEKYLEIGLKERIKLKDPVETGYVQLSLCRLNISTHEFKNAKENLLNLIQNLKDSINYKNFGIQNVLAKSLTGEALCLLSECEDSLGNSNLKYKHLFEAKTTFFELKDTLNQAYVLNLIGRSYMLDQQYEKAILYADSARQITKGGMILNQQALANKLLSDIYYDLKNYQLALKYNMEFMLLNDSMFNQSVTDAISNVDVLIGTITKEKDNQILKLNVANEKKIKNIIAISFSLFVILLVFVLTLIFVKYRQGRKINNELNLKNKRILEQQANLEKLNNDLNLLVKSRDKFHSIIAHDLRNPVSSVYSMVDLLSSSYDSLPDSTRKELITLTVETATKTLKLLDNLLAWSRLQGGYMKLKKSIFEITREVDGIVENLKHIADGKSIEVKVEHNGEIEVFADLEMISTVIRNLFSNAVKYSPEGKKIIVGIQQVEKMVEIWIEDEGIGIPKEKINELFQIDSEIQRPGTNDESGTGLGLQLSYEFVKLHNGYFEVKSVEYEGSRFAFFIPIRN